MKLEFIEVGRVVNAHGIRGDLKVHPIDCEAELIARCRTVYLNGAAFRPSHARVHKGCVLLHLPGVEDMDAAHAKHEAMGCICFENTAMGVYFIEDPDGYWIEIVRKK